MAVSSNKEREPQMDTDGHRWTEFGEFLNRRAQRGQPQPKELEHGFQMERWMSQQEDADDATRPAATETVPKAYLTQAQRAQSRRGILTG